jgi:hypothetical protein
VILDLSNESLDTICDWVETVALAQNGKPLSIQRAQELAYNQINIDEALVARAYTKLKTRSKSLGDHYPFHIDDTYIVAEKNAETFMYSQFLMVSPGSVLRTVKSWSISFSAKVFEKSAEQALASFFGNTTKTVNFGHPSEIGIPAEFPAAVAWLSELTNVRLGNSYRPPRKKDGGVDIFVWKDFGDKKPGIPLLLVQCTIMADYINKIGDIDIRLWSSWLSSDIDPLASLAIPCYVPEQNKWDEIATRGMLLDRERLVKLTEGPAPLSESHSRYLQNLLIEFESEQL